MARLFILNTFAHRPVAAYLAPHPTWSSRTGALVFPREIPVTPNAPLAPFLEGVEAGLVGLRGRPVFLAWAMEDPVFTSDFIDTYWRRSFPDAQVLRLPGAGHYLQEDAHEELVPGRLDNHSNAPRRSTYSPQVAAMSIKATATTDSSTPNSPPVRRNGPDNSVRKTPKARLRSRVSLTLTLSTRFLRMMW